MVEDQKHRLCGYLMDPLGSVPHVLFSLLPSSSELSDLDQAAPPTMLKISLRGSQHPLQCTHWATLADLKANMSQSSPSPSSSYPIEAYINGDFIEQGCMRDFSMVEADGGREAGEFPSPDACLSLPLLHVCTMPWPCLGHHVILGQGLLHSMPLGCLFSTLGVQLSRFSPSQCFGKSWCSCASVIS